MEHCQPSRTTLIWLLRRQPPNLGTSDRSVHLQPAPLLTLKAKPAAGWTVARSGALLIAALLVIWLVLDPSHALTIFWYAVIPILPATFFLTPALWRSVCPLATLNEMGNRSGTRRAPAPAPAPRTALALSVGGMALFYLLVPARHLVFNQNGPALAFTVVAVGGLAVALGAAFAVRSAFCNALCPILPVELLYGTAPLLTMERNRCATCTVCTPRGCFDLAKHKTIALRLGPARRTAHWIATPHGLFFAAFPGFVFGYNQVTDGPLNTAGVVYGTTLGWALASLLAVLAVVVAFRLPARRALPPLAAASGGLYYWYAGPAAAAQLGAPPWLAAGIRIGGIGLATYWLALTVARSRRQVGFDKQYTATVADRGES